MHDQRHLKLLRRHLIGIYSLGLCGRCRDALRKCVALTGGCLEPCMPGSFLSVSVARTFYVLWFPYLFSQNSAGTCCVVCLVLFPSSFLSVSATRTCLAIASARL